MGDLSAHFSKHEFRCSCCGRVEVSPRLIEVLEGIHTWAGIPMTITSGFRCPAHNAAVGGKPNSAHLRGEAADFFVSGSQDRFKFLEAAFMGEALRIGIGPDFIHIDVAVDLPMEVCWLYGAGA
jgi:uncharacterized protein YcbK (DUF882 family)